jgi:enediyne biosynthesis protein E4
MRFIYLLFFALAILHSCSSKDKPLFEVIPSSETGIMFSNTIVENQQLNMLTYKYLYNGGGVGIGDFNNDSLPDIYFTASITGNKLYLNRVNMKFEEVTEIAGVQGEKKWTRGATVVDINNDGMLDIYVCAAAWQSPELKKDILYVNQGMKAGTDIPVFRNTIDEYGLADTVSTHMASFFDYDNDGDLDLYCVVNDLNQEFPSNFRKIRNDGTGFTYDILYRNDWNPQLQHGVYTNVSKEAGITWGAMGLASALWILMKMAGKIFM